MQPEWFVILTAVEGVWGGTPPGAGRGHAAHLERAADVAHDAHRHLADLVLGVVLERHAEEGPEVVHVFGKVGVHRCADEEGRVRGG